MFKISEKLLLTNIVVNNFLLQHQAYICLGLAYFGLKQHYLCVGEFYKSCLAYVVFTLHHLKSLLGSK